MNPPKRATVEKLGPRTRQVWRFVCEYHDVNGYGPNHTDIRRGLGLLDMGRGSMKRHLVKLRRRGLIEWETPTLGELDRPWDEIRRARPLVTPSVYKLPMEWFGDAA